MDGPTSQQAEALLALVREGMKELRRLNTIGADCSRAGTAGRTTTQGGTEQLKPGEATLNEILDDVLKRMPGKLAIVCVIDCDNYLHALSAVDLNNVRSPAEGEQLDIVGDIVARRIIDAFVTIPVSDNDKEPPA